MALFRCSMPAAARILRPLEWGLVAFILFVFVRAGPSVFAVWGSLIGGRASTLLFTLGLVSAVQLLIKKRNFKPRN